MDAAGRWQYLYLDAHHARQSRRKFGRLVAFARALPALRASVRRDLALPDMPRERATAAALLLMSAAALRPGSEIYARENGTFGLATLRSRHLEVRGDLVTLTFRGKHGVRQHHRLRGRRLARLMREFKRRSGRDLFEFRDERGTWDLTRRHVNEYIKQAMGARFSARDFRTWLATLVCAAALRNEGVVPPAERRRAIVRAIHTTARVLGNTPNVVRTSYVHPAVLDAYRDGRVVAHAIDRPETLGARMPAGLHRAERAVLRLIEAA
jgi:DNA topoisomerase-1